MGMLQLFYEEVRLKFREPCQNVALLGCFLMFLPQIGVMAESSRIFMSLICLVFGMRRTNT